jgi:propanediol dehydratase small subunit
LLSLGTLAETLGRKLTQNALATYSAVLADLTRDNVILAFSRAAMECKFFPAPATLREYSGRAPTGDPLAKEAKEELVRIATAMRGKHGPKLKDIPGRVL